MEATGRTPSPSTLLQVLVIVIRTAYEAEVGIVEEVLVVILHFVQAFTLALGVMVEVALVYEAYLVRTIAQDLVKLATALTHAS